MTIEEIIIQEQLELNDDYDDFIAYCEYKALMPTATHPTYDDLCDYVLFIFFYHG